MEPWETFCVWGRLISPSVVAYRGGENLMWYPYQLSLCEFGYPLKPFVGKQLQHYIAIVVCTRVAVMRQWETVHCCFRVRSSIRLYCVYLLTEERVSGWYCVVIQLCKQLYSCFAIMGHLQLWVISNSIVNWLTNICGWMTYNCDTNASQIMLSYLYISKYIYEKHGHVIWKSEIPLWTFDLHGVFFSGCM